MKELKFVDVGEGITEGQIREFLVNDMQEVREDQPILKVETDKAIVDVPSPISGIIKIKAPPGSKVNVGDIIAYIGPNSCISLAISIMGFLSAPFTTTTLRPSGPSAASPMLKYFFIMISPFSLS